MSNIVERTKKGVRAYCFTVNNYTAEDEAQLDGLDCKYMIYGHEIAPTTGTPHLQGYVYFNSQRTMTAVVKDVPRISLREAKGSADSNFVYCSKEATDVKERGVRPMSQKEKGETERDRHAAAYRLIKEGKADEIPDDMQFKYHRNIESLKRKFMPTVQQADDVTGVWIWGEAGCGKSRKARKDYPGAYDKMCNKWWDGYQDEEYVLIDDLGLEHKCLGHHLKRWGDRYSFLAEFKGGAIQIRPKKIIVTSQYSIDKVFDDKETRDAISRRFFSINMPIDATE